LTDTKKMKNQKKTEIMVNIVKLKLNQKLQYFAYPNQSHILQTALTPTIYSQDNGIPAGRQWLQLYTVLSVDIVIILTDTNATETVCG